MYNSVLFKYIFHRVTFIYIYLFYANAVLNIYFYRPRVYKYIKYLYICALKTATFQKFMANLYSTDVTYFFNQLKGIKIVILLLLASV